MGDLHDRRRRRTHARRPGPSITLYFSGRDHAGEYLARLLALRPEDLAPPIRAGDAGSANFVGKLAVVDGGCWSHVRRKFVEIEAAFPDECRHVLDQIRTVYVTDREVKDLSPAARLALHQQQSAPVLEALKRWMEERLEQHIAEPISSLGAAFNYVLNHFKTLTTFLRMAGVPIDNNAAERGVRRSALHRRNSLFFRNAVGAWIGDVLMSADETCLLNGENPIAYFTEVVRHAAQIRANPAGWLPWTYPTRRARASPATGMGAGATARETGRRQAAR